MARDVNCPVCNGDLLLSGDEESGDDVFCAACQSPCVIDYDEDGDLHVKADF